MMALYGGALDETDLVQQAVTALIEERRTWNPKKIDIVGLLIGAMRSIASNYKAKSLASGYSVPESQLASGDGDEDADTPLDLEADSRFNAEQQMVAAEAEEGIIKLVAELYDFFQDDAEARLVMDGWREGHSGTEIIQLLEIDRIRYETIVKRIRRKSAARWPKVSSHVR